MQFVKERTADFNFNKGIPGPFFMPKVDMLPLVPGFNYFGERQGATIYFIKNLN